MDKLSRADKQLRMRVLFVTNTIAIGGAERQTLDVATELNKKEGVTVDVVYYARAEKEFCCDSAHTYYLPKMGSKLNFIKRLAVFIAKGNYDIVHCMGKGPANIYGRMAAILANTRVIIGAMGGKKNFINPWVRFVNGLLNCRTACWTVNNTALIPILLDTFKTLTPQRIRLIHNGFHPGDEIDFERDQATEYDADKDGNTIFIVIGRMEPVKNYGMFLTAAAGIASRYDKVRFWLVGDGSETERLKVKAAQLGLEKRVRFWGMRQDVNTALDRSDVFVLTSNNEGSPNTVAEALRAGKPVIATDCTDLSEMVDEGRNGFIIPVGDAAALEERMERILVMTESEVMAMREHSRQLFQETFLLEQTVEELLELYTELLRETW
jgi:glycosyltransferase involved in cell wall biosynthesis